jgi:hemerythrin
MHAIEWNNTYSIGVAEIDAQHKKLIEMLGELFKYVQTGHGVDIISKTLNSLSDYTVYHFEFEENLMVKYSYPYINEQKTQHRELRERVIKFLKDYSNDNNKLTIDVMKTMFDWLNNHIKGTDKKFGLYLNNKEIK